MGNDNNARAVPAGFDPKQAHVLSQWPAGQPMVRCRFEPKGRFVFGSTQSSTFQRFNLADGKPAPFAGGHDSWIFALAFSPEGERTYSCGGDGRVAAWETASGAPKPLWKIDAHHGWARAAEVSPDGKILATGGNDQKVRLWDAATGKPARELSGHEGHVYSLCFHPTGKMLISGDLMGSVREWDVASGKELGQFDAKGLHSYNAAGQHVHFGGVRGLEYAPDGGTVAAAGLHKATNPLGAVHEPLTLIFDARTRKLARTLLADGITQGVVWRLRYLADASLMAGCGGGSGGFLIFWKNGSDKDHHRLKLPGLVRDMDLHPDGLRVATAHHDGKLCITRLAAGNG